MKKHLFFYLCLLVFILSLLSKELLNLDDLVISSSAEQLTNDQIKEIISFQENWEWISYVILLLFLSIKIVVVAVILDAGCFFFEKEIKFKILLTIVIQSEFIFLLVIIFKTLWFYVFHQNFTLEDTQYFYPLSLLNLIDYQGLSSWWIYPLQVLNLFEVAYWFVLSYLLGKELKTTTSKGFSIVASSYGVGLLIWVGAVMFLTLNMS
mgnify:FL=1